MLPDGSSTSWRHGRCAAWVDRLSDLIGLLGELRSRDIDLYLHQQALDTSTPSGRALFGMLGVFSEFERAMIRDRVMAGLDRATVVRQASGPSQDDAVHGTAHSSGIGSRTRCARDGTAAEGICGQGERDQANVGHHGWFAFVITPGDSQVGCSSSTFVSPCVRCTPLPRARCQSRPDGRVERR